MKFTLTTPLAALALATTVSASPINQAVEIIKEPQQLNSTNTQPPAAPYSGYAIEVIDDVDDVTMSGQNTTHADSFFPIHRVPWNGVIPITDFKCTGNELDKKDVDHATEKVLAWGQRRANRIEAKSYYNVPWGTATWYFCNCKWKPWDDKLPVEEVEEVIDFLEQQCGAYWSGWVYSQYWLKGYNIAPTKDLVGKDPNHLCPPWCFF